MSGKVVCIPGPTEVDLALDKIVRGVTPARKKIIVREVEEYEYRRVVRTYTRVEEEG